MYYKKDLVLDIVKIVFGAILMGISVSVFFASFNIAPGGVSGVSSILWHITRINTGVWIVLINIPIFILGFTCFRFRFLVKSIIGTLVLSISCDIAAKFSPPTSDPIVACLIGSVIMGIGISSVISAGGTTGGTDIVVLCIRKFYSNISVGRLYLLIDGIVVMLSGIVFKSYSAMIFSAASILVSSYVTDISIDGFKTSRLVYIMSEKDEKITLEIYRALNRGVTGLKSISMYNGSDKNVLLCAIKRQELNKLKKIIYSVDEEAFVIVCEAKDIMGNGFVKTII